MVELAIATGIPMSEWAAADDASIATALTVLDEQARQARRGR
jgi:hypothetical protein